MKASSISMLVMAIYVAIVGLSCLFIPNPTALGFPPTDTLWVRITGYLLCALSFYYIMAVREQNMSFYRWSVYGRFPIFFVWNSFWLLGLGPAILVPMGAVDLRMSIWTWLALRSEQAQSRPHVGISARPA